MSKLDEWLEKAERDLEVGAIISSDDLLSLLNAVKAATKMRSCESIAGVIEAREEFDEALKELE
jgi:hypothetical protein